MRRKNSKDVVDIFTNLKKVLNAKPSMGEMFEDVRMMRFKIKPISGDISLLHLKNYHLIETLWSLGKLDEMFQREYKTLTKDQKDVFFKIFDNLYQQFQDQLNRISVSPEKKSNISHSLEMEIFKDVSPQKKFN